MLKEEEIDAIVWEQKRQKAIKALQKLKQGEHFVVAAMHEGNHNATHLLTCGCSTWLMQISVEVAKISLGMRDVAEG